MEIKNAKVLEHTDDGGVIALVEGPTNIEVKVRVVPAKGPITWIIYLDPNGQVGSYSLGAVVDGIMLWTTEQGTDQYHDEEGNPIPSKKWLNPATGNPAGYDGSEWHLGE